MAIYGDSDSKGGAADSDEAPVKPLEELVEELDEAVRTIEYFLVDECKFSLSKIIDAEDTLHKIKHIQEGYNAICDTMKPRLNLECFRGNYLKSIKH